MPVSGTRTADLFRIAGYQELPILSIHATAVEALPAIHGDPFDSILVVQSLIEPLRLITHDRIVARYSDTILFI
jgi:PIN domain nuclease of toxin-antitoxin system